MSKCKMCDAHLDMEDLMVDEDYCLECVNSSEGEDESYGLLHSTRIPGGQLYLIKKRHSYVVDTLTYHYEDESETHLRSKYNTVEEATDRYLNLLREYL